MSPHDGKLKISCLARREILIDEKLHVSKQSIFLKTIVDQFSPRTVKKEIDEGHRKRKRTKKEEEKTSGFSQTSLTTPWWRRPRWAKPLSEKDYT